MVQLLLLNFVVESAQAVMQYYNSLIQRLKQTYYILIVLYGQAKILVYQSLSAMLKKKFSKPYKTVLVSPYFTANSLFYQAKSWIAFFNLYLKKDACIK